MSNLVNTYLAGGVMYMHLLTLLFLFNLGAVGYIIFCKMRKKDISGNWLEVVKHIGGLAVAFGTFGTLMGLLFAFDALESSKDIIPFQVIMGGLKVSLINVLYGLMIFCISMLAYIILKLRISITHV